MEPTFLFSLAAMPGLPAGQAAAATQKNGFNFLEVLEAEIRLLAENLPAETSRLKLPAAGGVILAAANAKPAAAGSVNLATASVEPAAVSTMNLAAVVEPGKPRMEDKNDDTRIQAEEQLEIMASLLLMGSSPTWYTPDAPPQAAPPGNPEAGVLAMATTEEAQLNPAAAAQVSSADLKPAKPAAFNAQEEPPLRVVAQEEASPGAGSAAKPAESVEGKAPHRENSVPVEALGRAAEAGERQAVPGIKPVTAHRNKEGAPIMPVNASSSTVEAPVMPADVSSKPVEVRPVHPMEALPVNLQAVPEGMGRTRPATTTTAEAQDGEAATGAPAKPAGANPALGVSDVSKQPLAENANPAERRQPVCMSASPGELGASEPVQRTVTGMEPVTPTLHSPAKTELPRVAPGTTTEPKPQGVVPATFPEPDPGPASSVKQVEMKPVPQPAVVETRSLQAVAAAPVEPTQGESLISTPQREIPTQEGVEIKPVERQPGQPVGLRTDALPGGHAPWYPNAESVSVSGDDLRQAGVASLERAPFQALSKSAAGKYASGESAGLELAQLAGLKSGVTTPNMVEPARMAEAHNSGLIRQVSQNIEVLVKTGQPSLKIHLQPNDLQITDLGKIDLHLTSTADGMQVSITAERPVTGLLLERHLNELRQSLSDAGVQLSGLSVGLSSSQDRSATAQHWQSKQAEAAPPARQKTQPEADIQEHIQSHRLETDLRVDYRI